MLQQAATVALRILLFRAGPQDLPHAQQLVAPVPALAASAYFMLWALVLPPGSAALVALAGIGSLAMVTHSVLTARGVANRFQQTYHALLLSTGLIALAWILPMMALAPTLKQVIANPDLLKDPAGLQVPPVASIASNLMELWTFAVFAHVLRHAANTNLLVGALLALFVILSAMLVSMLAIVLLSPLVR